MGLINNYFYSFIYALSTSLSFIAIAKIEKELPTLLSLFISILISVTFFHLINFNSMKYVYKRIIQFPMLWMVCSFVIVIMWITSFYGAKEVGGFVFLFIYFISSAIISYVFIILNRSKISYYEIFSAVGLFVLVSVFMISNFDSFTGILLGIIGGVCSYCYRKLSFIIANKCYLLATQRLAISYYFIILPFPFLISGDDYALLNFETMSYLAGIAILSFIIPLYANQKGIEHAGPEHHSIIAAICPLLTCLLEFYIEGIWIWSILIYSIMGSFFLILGKIK